MTNEELKIKLAEILPAAIIEDGNEWIELTIEPTEWLSFAKQLRNDDTITIQFSFLPYLY